jgi:hypothetical protein
LALFAEVSGMVSAALREVFRKAELAPLFAKVPAKKNSSPQFQPQARKKTRQSQKRFVSRRWCSF